MKVTPPYIEEPEGTKVDSEQGRIRRAKSDR
jgi:hypothetical protein